MDATAAAISDSKPVGMLDSWSGTSQIAFGRRMLIVTSRIAVMCAALLFGPCMMGTIAIAQPVGSDRVSNIDVSNIEKAAAEIAAIQTKGGANGASAAISECYKRELVRATTLTPGLEACMAQDIIMAKMTAGVNLRLSLEGRKMAGAEDPDAVLKAMTQRVVGVFDRFKVSQEDARAFNRIVQEQGMQAYGRARYPGVFPAKG